ncbi:MAG: double-strand break repair helicase AddA, partial [Pseudomonadota bacterium]
MSEPGSAPPIQKDETARLQNLASDPRRSAWVSANAGSGKTHVLTQRVIRLMLAGARPSSILCLTYTKAAASEMSNRVFDRLSHWTSLDDAALGAEIAAMEGNEANPAKVAEARRLFARALETPGGLKIQTIHAFCESLLHQFPLEANVAGHFEVLDDVRQQSLLAEARRTLLTATQMETHKALAKAFHEVLSIADESGLERLLDDIVGQRSAISGFLGWARKQESIETALARGLDLQLDDLSEEAIALRAADLAGLEDHRLRAYLALCEEKGGAKVKETATKLASVRREADPVAGFLILKDAFLKKTDEQPYADGSLFSAAMAKADPLLCETIGALRYAIFDLWQSFKTARMVKATEAALVLADTLVSAYEKLKRERAFLDFDDFIARTVALLAKQDIGTWVHFKLDQGIDHILVDEAQDTSPQQWDIIRSLASEFFAGEGARPVNRTIFAVGDEKQSIYSFQGARPERFALERAGMEARARTAEKLFEPLNLRISFRSTDDVLSAVDGVFESPDHARGLNALGEPIQHVSNRIGQAGAVDIWEIIAEEATDEEDEDWLAPFDRLPETSSASELARRMAACIGEMVGRQVIASRNGPRLVSAGDILVLVRKRDAFAAALAKELKRSTNVPVAGTDRLVLSSHIAIQDLMALGRFVTLPEDDLSLAALIKSPLLDLGEADLYELAAERQEDETVWQALTRLSEGSEPWQRAFVRLNRWKVLARLARPHDFYADLLARDGGRRLFLARFGHEVSDVLDEFLNFALAHEQAGLPGLTSFIATLETESPEIKREQDKGREEVRIMTVHASKGLEAPVVFLVDGGSKPFDKTLLPKLRVVKTKGPIGDVPLWIPGKSYQNPISDEDDERLKASAEEEYRRLLYV